MEKNLFINSQENRGDEKTPHKNHKKTFADFDDFIKYILSKIDSSNGK